MKFFWQFIAAIFGAAAVFGLTLLFIFIFTNWSQYEPSWLETVVIISLIAGPILGALITVLLIHKLSKKIA